MSNAEMASFLYNELLNSDIEDKETFIKELKTKIEVQ